MIIGDHLVEKTCIKCGFVGDEALFTKRRNTCKKCTNAVVKKYRENNPEKIKECSKKHYEKHRKEILEKAKIFGQNNPSIIKEKNRKHYLAHTKECNLRSKKYREEHLEELKIKEKLYREANAEKLKEKNKHYYYKDHEKTLKQHKKYYKKYYENNKEKISTHIKEYRLTPNGKLTVHKHRAKRRKLGHEPINAWFKGSEAHHLRYSTTSKEQDNNLVIHVPKELHRSMWHNGRTGENMKAINMLLLEWYVENTPEEQRNPLALQLLKNYKEFPEPIWKQ